MLCFSVFLFVFLCIFVLGCILLCCACLFFSVFSVLLFTMLCCASLCFCVFLYLSVLFYCLLCHVALFCAVLLFAMSVLYFSVPLCFSVFLCFSALFCVFMCCAIRCYHVVLLIELCTCCLPSTDKMHTNTRKRRRPSRRRLPSTPEGVCALRKPFKKPWASPAKEHTFTPHTTNALNTAARQAATIPVGTHAPTPTVPKPRFSPSTVSIRAPSVDRTPTGVPSPHPTPTLSVRDTSPPTWEEDASPHPTRTPTPVGVPSPHPTVPKPRVSPSTVSIRAPSVDRTPTPTPVGDPSPHHTRALSVRDTSPPTREEDSYKISKNGS